MEVEEVVVVGSVHWCCPKPKEPKEQELLKAELIPWFCGGETAGRALFSGAVLHPGVTQDFFLPGTCEDFHSSNNMCSLMSQRHSPSSHNLLP